MTDAPEINQDFKIYKGEIKSLYITVTDKDTGELVDFTGKKLIYRVALNPNSKEYLITKKKDNTHTQIVVTETGVCRVDFLHADTSLLEAKKMYHEFAVTGTNVDLLLMTGAFILGSRITNLA